MKAFPTPTFSINNEARVTAVGGEGGMELRDYFAAKAMQGFIQYSATKGIYTPPDNELAKVSYDLADAMMRAREK
jgi:hypothetical protein